MFWSFLPWEYFLQNVCLHHCLCESYARQVIATGGWTPTCFWAASCQHGDLGAEIGAAANRRVLVFGVRAHVSLQVPPSPLPLNFSLNLQLNKDKKKIYLYILYHNLWFTVKKNKKDKTGRFRQF